MGKNLTADKANCTFWWKIYLDPKHPDNKPTVKVIDGYSKFVKHNEAKDKEDVLMAKIEMLWKNGYIKKSIAIEIFTRLGPLPNATEDKLFLTLKPNDYILHEKYISKTPWRIKEFLKNFYDCISKGRQVTFLRPLKPMDKTVENKDDIFNISKHNFTSYSQLYDWSNKQKELGEAPGLIDSFVKRYISEKLDTPKSDQMDKLLQNFNKKV